MQGIYTAGRLFTGKEWLSNQAVVTENGRIKSILPLTSLGSDQKVQQFDNSIIAPAFIDLQIYGAGGKLLAVYPEARSLQILALHNRNSGTAYCLPTVATNTKEVFFKCIDAVRDYWQQGGEGIPGLHLEGPWINTAKRGAHVESLVHPPTVEEVRDLLQYGKGVIRLITLAPECCSDEVIELILSEGILISAGHSNANYSEARSSFKKGIRLVTHLYNAMSPLHHRETGLVGAAMDDNSIMASIIPDGHHVDYSAIRIAKKAMGERLFAITDAVTETSEGYYQHQPAGDKFESGGVLSGSAITMAVALKNLVEHAGISIDEGLRMCSSYPAKALGMQDEIGSIKIGARSEMILLNEKLEFQTIIS